MTWRYFMESREMSTGNPFRKNCFRFGVLLNVIRWGYIGHIEKMDIKYVIVCNPRILATVPIHRVYRKRFGLLVCRNTAGLESFLFRFTETVLNSGYLHEARGVDSAFDYSVYKDLMGEGCDTFCFASLTSRLTYDQGRAVALSSLFSLVFLCRQITRNTQVFLLPS